ncbi:U-scoloptoxin(01)-Er1a isoform X2 [Hyalella azteca]|uniref:U-scoloptoxin(01)-Er1a isoform X1 n=2 Tax=Hyalella azteca TaxID=294128 RepID=A0A8B7NAA2_HYAAZ|nr:U-scoloptoxin(01)-Er1a isoform X1 [Hyalella azteca]XP_018010511.1 U-scoloptoxin(01)-Er1a isoform X2 [Hyalella azteca]
MTRQLPTFFSLAVMVIACTVVCSLPTLSRVKRWEEFPNVTFTFDCTDRPVGFYADQEFNCQLFHMCDEDGRRIPHMCANDTAFNQEYRICDWASNVDCDNANQWFYLNELTYVTDPPRYP